VPLVTSSGFPLPVLYEDRFGRAHRHVTVATATERVLSRAVGAVGAEVPWLPPRRAVRVMVQSEHYRGAGDGRRRPGDVVVRTLGIDGVARPRRTGRPTPVGFTSTMSEEKGGTVVLAAFPELLAERPDARLVVGSGRRPTGAGSSTRCCPPSTSSSTRRAATPGRPNVILGALQRGIPVVTSDPASIDEGLTGPGVRRVPADPLPVSGALIDLFDPETSVAASAAAIALWRSRYSMDVLAELIGTSYREAQAARS